jgi:hypothetical protein
MHDESFDSELGSFEARLRSLTPQSGLDRDRLMFSAGEHAARRRYRMRYRLLAGTNAALAILLVAVVVAPRAVEPLAYVPVSSKTLLAKEGALPAMYHARGDRRSSDSGDVLVARSVSTSFEELQQIEQDSTNSSETSDEARPREPAEIAPSPSTSRGLLHRYLNAAT